MLDNTDNIVGKTDNLTHGADSLMGMLTNIIVDNTTGNTYKTIDANITESSNGIAYNMDNTVNITDSSLTTLTMLTTLTTSMSIMRTSSSDDLDIIVVATVLPKLIKGKTNSIIRQHATMTTLTAILIASTTSFTALIV